MLSSLLLNNQQLERALDRLALYLGRVRNDLEKGDRYQALADLAEVGEISRRLWNRVQAESSKKPY